MMDAGLASAESKEAPETRAETGADRDELDALPALRRRVTLSM